MKILKFFFAIVMITLLFTGCKYSFIVPEEVPVIDPNDPNAVEIKFSSDILPIFTNNSNCTSCHNTGGQIPDLTAENAFSSLNSTRYINSGTPNESLIYTIANPDTEEHQQKKYTATEAVYVLAWIQQGAKNN
ncbi:MAG: hypothetical protein HN778_20560 [Prolixibacteraceae bacterium]|jgi:hypothetical protein|nr:hypothetical protein [Prolixibacteraceae bacterium]MBT6763254.1 hypothetical protein [Prolixibacteraceae bacterium]MBT7000313.1 hypothetical protein [Prolixibacteraceae bacterium]MBT7397230.1 hypothetical protein [Prolixibacteraceae bacterium]